VQASGSPGACRTSATGPHKPPGHEEEQELNLLLPAAVRGPGGEVLFDPRARAKTSGVETLSYELLPGGVEED